MLRYFLKRILLMVPTLLISVLLAFLLTEAAPMDPAEGMLNLDKGKEIQYDRETWNRNYKELRHKFGMDLPVFYFSISSMAQPDTLYKVMQSGRRKALSRLADQYGNWEKVYWYNSALNRLESDLYAERKKDPYNDSLRLAIETCNTLGNSYDKANIYYSFSNLLVYTTKFPFLTNDFTDVETAYENMLREKTPYKKYIPTFHWYGFQNRFNLWIGNILRGDFGESYFERRPVMSILKEAIPWTLLINGLAIFIAFALSIPIGVLSSIRKNAWYNKLITILLFALYSLPVFWIGTLLIIYFGGGDYLNWFPTSGVSDMPSDASFMQKLPDVLWHLVLPVTCLVYGSFAFISRQVRSSMLGTMNQEYIRTARAKGLGDFSIVWKHTFRNALLPMITLIGAILPALINGSVLVESMFSIPGMGQKSYFAVQSQDYPIIFATLILAAVLTMAGNLIADLLYAVADPRISFKSTTEIE